MDGMRYSHNAGSVYNLNLHFVWCPKYRKPVLVGRVADRLRELIVEKSAQLGVEVLALEVMPDHVHLFLAVPPTDAPQFYANQFKGHSSRILRLEFPHLKSTLPSLWSRSYYVGSAGHVSSETIEKYIANQRGR